MVNLKNDTKQRFDALQPAESTQNEFVETLLDHYEADDDLVVIDGDDIREELDYLAGVVELAAYRGANAALEDAE